ncbi:FkbM family methyltransferase [Paracoccus alkanivorans]|uniref:FkbM family methyltransferase n=1 Tax=Paracoccus alkanivorans TaxID=2116655 RepID=A0A3M0MFC1_9RHOB|nr:FkbM family methyltransferase [Paracoccus alkanivorans]RMC36368.1 FkbM family methyltransferase [Paracoccus alkanivorans]
MMDIGREDRSEIRIKHLLAMLAPERKTRIVDIGANPVNQPPYGALRAVGGCEIWGFEPQKAAFDKLVADCGEDEHYFCEAVGSGGQKQLNVCQSRGFTSLLEPNPAAFKYLGRWHQATKVVETVRLNTSRLDDIEGLPDFDLLKIDVQGGEQAVFAGGTDKLKNAVAVVTEIAAIPIYKNQPLLDEQMAMLRGLGYFLHTFLHFTAVPVNSSSGRGRPIPKQKRQLVDGDAVFIRDLLALEEMESERLKHLAILADTTFSSFSLTLRCLDILLARKEVTDDAVTEYVEFLPVKAAG